MFWRSNDREKLDEQSDRNVCGCVINAKYMNEKQKIEYGREPSNINLGILVSFLKVGRLHYNSPQLTVA